MNVDSDESAALYSRLLLDLAQGATVPQRLAAPDASASAVSVICGSTVTIDITLDPQGNITAFGFESQACALTRAVLAVMRDAALGQSRTEIAKAGKGFAAFLDQGEPAPLGRWEKLGLLGNLRDYRARHPSMLLPFEAIEKAFLLKTQ